MKISVAGLTVELNNRYDHIVRLARDYTAPDSEPDFSVFATDEELEEERRASNYNFDNGYLESIVLYRKIAEQLPRYNAYVFHGAVLGIDGEAYAFTAKSGVGKTTHIRLWHEVFGNKVHVLNGDKPIIRFIDGVPYAAGTPWRGKENYGIPEMLPLKGIGFLERAEQNSAEEMSISDAQIRLVSQMYIPKDRMGALLALGLADKTLKSVRLVSVRANMEREAAEKAYRVLALKSVNNMDEDPTERI